MTVIKCDSLVRVFGTVPYQNPWEDDGHYFFELDEKQKVLCMNRINVEIRKLFQPVNFLIDKISKISLNVAIKEKKLVSILNCCCSGKLTQQEMQNLWNWQCRYGFEKRLEFSRIRTQKYGRLKVILRYTICKWNIIENQPSGIFQMAFCISKRSDVYYKLSIISNSM